MVRISDKEARRLGLRIVPVAAICVPYGVDRSRKAMRRLRKVARR